MNSQEDHFDVNPNLLPMLVLQHSAKMRAAGRAAADAKREAKRAEAKRKVTYAELDKAIRSDPERFGITKVSEGAIENAIIRHSRYREVVEQEIITEHEADIAKVDYDTFADLRYGLQDGTKFFLGGFFADVKVPHQTRKEMEEEREERELVNRRKIQS